MDDTAKTLITLGIVLLLGLASDAIARRTRLPRVTLLLIFGFVIGPAGLDFLSPNEEKWFSIITDMALIMIGFLLGEKFTLPLLRQHGKFMILFFVLAGASLQFETVFQIGFIGSAYIIFRIIGRLLGGWTGGAISHAKPLMSRWMGIALMPQAGVALGMALVTIEHRPDLGEIILPVVIASTVLFELIGPVLTQAGLTHVGEVRSDL
jgi:Kef-type K+ transport system membrane component KefB